MPNTIQRPAAADPRERAYASLLRHHGPGLAAVVAAIAEDAHPDLDFYSADSDRTRLIIALTLLAAGLPAEVVASPDESLRSALRVLDEFSGVECYLLRHGLTVEHFHVLRERLGDAYNTQMEA